VSRVSRVNTRWLMFFYSYFSNWYFFQFCLLLFSLLNSWPPMFYLIFFIRVYHNLITNQTVNLACWLELIFCLFLSIHHLMFDLLVIKLWFFFLFLSIWGYLVLIQFFSLLSNKIVKTFKKYLDGIFLLYKKYLFLLISHCYFFICFYYYWFFLIILLN
jgi:hypothetical protein